MTTPHQKLQSLLLLFLGFGAIQIQAFDNYHTPNYASLLITGKIIDAESKMPLGYATISLFNATDSTLIDGNITNEKGFFQLSAKPGNYYATIEFLAYQKQLIKNIKVQQSTGNVDLGIIELSPETTTLKEVIVKVERSEMVMTLDKKIFYVGKDLTARGGSAIDLLDNVPSVQVDVEGNVSLRGNKSVQILVDGKPSALANSANGLQTLQANMIERIELITNPSARYQGEGTAGILNIILKKNRKKGVNGSFASTVGFPRNYGLSFNLNYRAKKLNFFANYGIKVVKNPNESSKYQTFLRNDSTFIVSQVNEQTQINFSNNFRFGIDYYFNPKNILTTAFHYSIADNKSIVSTTYNDKIFDEQYPADITVRTQDAIIKSPTLEYALTYKKTFAEKGRKWTVDLRYQEESERDKADFMNRFYTAELLPQNKPSVIQQSNNTKKLGQSTFQTDYVHPFSKDHKFEAGLHNAIRKIDNDYLLEQWTDKGFVSLQEFTNHFRYYENISAAYLQYGNKINKLSYLIGFRMEYSRIRTQLSAGDHPQIKDYFTPIPTLHLTYDLPKKNALQWSYSRRLRRPRFWDFNPFYSYSDDRSFFRGNPELDPAFSHAVEFGHLKNWDKGSLNSAIYYRYTTGKIERIRYIEEDGDFYNQPQNLNTENAYGIEFTATYSPFKWWRLNAYINFYQSFIDGTNIAPSLKSDTYSWYSKGSSKFIINKKTNIQIRYSYSAPKITPQGKSFELYKIDFAASRKVFKEKGTLTFGIRDVFNSYRYSYISEGSDFYTESTQQWLSRNFTLTLNYQLN